VLVLGRSGAEGSGYLWDAGSGAWSARIPARAPDALARLGDGSIAELASGGAALRREDEPTPYDDPPATIVLVEDDAWLVLDPTDRERAAPAWSAPSFLQIGDALVAQVPGARVDLRSIRASRLDVAVRSTGAIELLAIPERAPPVVIAIDDETISIGGCIVARGGDALAEIALDPGAARIGRGAAARECEVALSAPFSIALRAREAGARMISVGLARRPR
jgi:hypothetical protein